MQTKNFEIRLNGAQIMSGDSLSTRVIFFNLSGRNFLPEYRHAGDDQTHEQYLQFMERELGVELVGGLLELLEGGQVQERHRVEVVECV